MLPHQPNIIQQQVEHQTIQIHKLVPNQELQLLHQPNITFHVNITNQAYANLAINAVFYTKEK